MPAPAWSPGTLYLTGALVRPRSAPAVVTSALINPTFEDGDTDWTLGTGFSIGEFGAAFEGTWSLKYDDTNAAVRVTLNDAVVPVVPGQVIAAGCQVQQGASSAGQAGGTILIRWYTALMALISEELGNAVNSGSGGQWKLSQVSATAPPTAAFAQLGIGMFRLSGAAPLYADYFSSNYIYSAAPEGLLYKAVQQQAGVSGSAEPAWPIVVAGQVTDNEVVWEGVITSRVTYVAHPILKSGASEPVFPGEVGISSLPDGTIYWQAVSRQITDEKCPHSKVVAIAASKVFAGNGDIIPFSATSNALDWSTADDAGFLPFGLQTYGSNPVAAMGLYRSNLVAFNAAGAQMWQVDQDPVNMALLDAVPVPCTYPKSIAPVANDLALLTSLGVRNLTIAAASTNLQAGEFGKAIDPLVKVAIAGGETPIGLYYPGSGQYMLFFGAEAFVFTLSGAGGRVSRSRYVFPAAITDWTVLDNDLYLRAGELVWRFDEHARRDNSYFLTASSQLICGVGTENGGANPERFGLMLYVVAGEPNFGSFDNSGAVTALYSEPDGADFRLVLVLAGPAVYGAPAGPLEQDFFTTLEVRAGATTSFPEDGETVITLQSEDADFYTLDEYFEGAESLRPTEMQFVWVWYIDSNALQVAYTNPSTDVLARITGGLADYYDNLGADFIGYLAWPYLDLAALGQQTMLHGFDLVGVGEVDVQFGYDQSNFAYVTDSYVVQAETLPGMPIAMPISAPSVQLRLTFSANQAWSWAAARLYDSPVTR